MKNVTCERTCRGAQPAQLNSISHKPGHCKLPIREEDMDELNFDGKTILVVGGPIGISLQRGLVAVSRYQLVSWVGGASIGIPIAASTARRPIDLDGMACDGSVF